MDGDLHGDHYHNSRLPAAAAMPTFEATNAYFCSGSLTSVAEKPEVFFIVVVCFVFVATKSAASRFFNAV